jgi:hypothetical protein
MVGERETCLRRILAAAAAGRPSDAAVARFLLRESRHLLQTRDEMLYEIELDGRIWWNSASIEQAKALAAPYLRHGRQVLIRAHASQRDKVALVYDHALGRWQDVLGAACEGATGGVAM